MFSRSDQIITVMFLENQIIEYLDDDQLKVGFVRKQEHDRLQVVDPRGRQTSIPGDRVVVIHQKTGENQFPAMARELSERVRVRQEEMDVELLWESVGGKQREFTPAELAALFYSEPSPEAVSAIFRSLTVDTLYFRRKGIQFIPRSSEQVGTERTRRERQQEHEQIRDTLIESLKRLIQSKAIESTPDIEPILVRLQNWIRRESSDSIGTLLEEIAGLSRARDVAYDILLRAGRVDPRRDRFLVIAGIEEEFPAVVEEAAARLAMRNGGNRIDYRRRPAFTIDDEDTLEIDDAITVEEEDGGIVVGIHIADVSAFVEKGDRLDLEAAQRSSTIYLPANTVRMFPDPLSTNLASLRENEDRPAFTVEVRFDHELNRLGYRIVLSTIRVARRLTYDIADELINNSDGEPALKTLHAIALRLQQERALRGAVTIRRPEFQIHVDDGGIHVGKLDPNSPSRLLVSEMMILCNGLAADFASVNGLPVIYRTQEPRDSSAITDSSDMNPIAFEKLRKTFKRSRLSLTPGLHSGLGLGAYTQVSSPIRRYADLVTQQQFTAFLKAKPLPYEREELLSILTNAETTEQEIRSIEDRSTNYWILEYLSREKMTQPMSAVLLDRKGNIELEDCYLRGKLQSPGGEEPGSVLSVMIDTIDPGKGNVRFKRA